MKIVYFTFSCAMIALNFSPSTALAKKHGKICGVPVEGVEEQETIEIANDYPELVKISNQAAIDIANSSRGEAIIKEIDRYLKAQAEKDAKNENNSHNNKPNRYLRAEKKKESDENSLAPNQEEVEKLLEELTSFGEFNTVLDAATVQSGTGSGSSGGIVGVGIGVAASYGLVIKGKEYGIEGIYVLASNTYGVNKPAKFVSRSWNLKGKGINLLASAGIQFTFWFDEPVAEPIVAVVTDCTVIVGARVTGIWTSNVLPPGSDRALVRAENNMHKKNAKEKKTKNASKGNKAGKKKGQNGQQSHGKKNQQKSKMNQQQLQGSTTSSAVSYAAFAVRPSIGLEIGIMGMAGKQSIPYSYNKMTLFVEPAAMVTGGTPTTLHANLTNPTGRQGNYDLGVSTSLTLNLPYFLNKTVNDIVFTTSGPGWTQGNAINGANPKLVIDYTGEPMEWASPLSFTLTQVTSEFSGNSSGFMRANVTGNPDGNLIVPSNNATLALVGQACNATIDWEAELGTTYDISFDEGSPTSGTNVVIHMLPPSAGNNFVQLASVTKTTSVANGKSSTTTPYALGYVFEENSSSIPTITLYWWQSNKAFHNAIPSPPMNYPTVGQSEEAQYSDNYIKATVNSFSCYPQINA